MVADIYTQNISSGPTRLREKIGEYLASRMPLVIDAMRLQRLDLSDNLLPYPNKYDVYDANEADNYPVVGVYVSSTDEWKRVETTTRGTQYFDVKYDVTLFVVGQTAQLGLDNSSFVIWETPERDSAIKMRDNLHTALRQVVINGPSFGTAGTDMRLSADIESIKEAFPPPIQAAQTSVYVCSGVMNLSVFQYEPIVAPTYGPVETISTDIELMGAVEE